MDLIRKILVLSANTEWARDLSTELKKSNKLQAIVGSNRPTSLKEITENKFAAVVIEDSFTKKNIDYLLRAFISQNCDHPKFIFLCFLDFNLYRQIVIPEELESEIVAHSYPLEQEEMAKIISSRLLKCSLATALKDCSEGMDGVDFEFINIFMNATDKTLIEFGALENIQSGTPFMMRDSNEDLEVKIRGKIIIKSEFFSGSFFVSFPEKTYLAIYNKVLGSDDSGINDKNSDFAGELANMIYGQSKKVLAEQGANLDMAIPVTDESPKLINKKPIIIVPFTSNLGNFYIKLAKDLF